MKRCVILFAILIVTLIIAVWTDHNKTSAPSEEVALEAGHPASQPQVADPLSK